MFLVDAIIHVEDSRSSAYARGLSQSLPLFPIFEFSGLLSSDIFYNNFLQEREMMIHEPPDKKTKGEARMMILLLQSESSQRILKIESRTHKKRSQDSLPHSKNTQKQSTRRYHERNLHLYDCTSRARSNNLFNRGICPRISRLGV